MIELETPEQFMELATKRSALREARVLAFPTLEDKIAFMQVELGTLGNDEQNNDGAWGFTSITKLVESVKLFQRTLALSIRFEPLLDTLKEDIIPTTRGECPRASITVVMHVRDLDSKEELRLPIRGEAHDPNGKALFQAQTYARRWAMINTFNIVMRDEAGNVGDGDKSSIAINTAEMLARDTAKRSAATHQSTAKATNTEAVIPQNRTVADAGHGSMDDAPARGESVHPAKTPSERESLMNAFRALSVITEIPMNQIAGEICLQWSRASNRDQTNADEAPLDTVRQVKKMLQERADKKAAANGATARNAEKTADQTTVATAAPDVPPPTAAVVEEAAKPMRLPAPPLDPGNAVPAHELEYW